MAERYYIKSFFTPFREVSKAKALDYIDRMCAMSTTRKGKDYINNNFIKIERGE